jgi:glycosyltransferase involved in cell wall biosynthesis
MSGGGLPGHQIVGETGRRLPKTQRSLSRSRPSEGFTRSHPPTEPERPSLLVLTSTFPKSRGDSTPAFVLDLSKHLQSRFRVTVLTPVAKGALDRDEIEGVQVRRFHYFWPRSLQILADGALLENVRRRRWLLLLAPFLLLFEFVAAFRWARASRPAAIHAHWFVPQGLVAVVVGGLLKVPVVITSHGGDIYGLRGRFWAVVRKALTSRAAAVTVVSRDMAANLSGLTSRTGEAPRVMPMGVDTVSFQPAQSDEALRERLSIGGPLILFVGRLAEKKGVRYLLEAMPDVLRHSPGCTLVIAGDGPLRGQLEALANRLGIGDSVRFVGGVSHDELPAYYASADVFVGPSIVAQGGDTEAFGVVFAEAMAAGRPIVATSVGGVADIVVQGRTGLLVEPESARAVAEAIKELLDSPEKASRMGTLAQRWVRIGFDWRRVAARYAALLDEVAGGRRDPVGAAASETGYHHPLRRRGRDE